MVKYHLYQKKGWKYEVNFPDLDRVSNNSPRIINMNLGMIVETLWELIRIFSAQQKKGSTFEVNLSNSDRLILTQGIILDSEYVLI